jgi:hypothetical protein
MKRRVRKIANFFAFNLLFFALYLNFIHKDKIGIPTADQAVQPKTAAFSETAMVNNASQQQNTTVATPQESAPEATQTNGTALRLSIN